MSTKRHTTHPAEPPTHDEIFGHEKTTSEIELGLLQMQILWLLRRKATHGYEMMQELAAIRRKKITQGTLYPTLQRLESLALVKRNAEGNRIMYHLTRRGEKTLDEACTEFCKTFFGVFQDVVCAKCVEPL